MATLAGRMKIMVLAIILAQVKWSVQQYSQALHPSPGYDGCYSYNYLSSFDRNIGSYGGNYYCDSSLEGWYRFVNDAGSRMLNYCPRYYSSGACYAQYKGWMSGSLPRWYDGTVRRTVYFAYYHNCYEGHADIWVKNCGSFYVYYFQRYRFRCNYRYCGDPSFYSSVEITTAVPASSSSSPVATSIHAKVMPTPSGHPCYSYRYLSDQNRNMYYKGNYQLFCDNSLQGWFRFGGAAGSKMLNHCPHYNVDYPSNMNGYCRANYQGWVYGSEPSYYEGTVLRTIWFASTSTCYYKSRSVYVRNCGGFLVYYLSYDYRIPCNYRYCGMADSIYVTTTPGYSREVISSLTVSPTPSSSLTMEATEIATEKPSLDGCKYYQVLSESDRAHSYRGWTGKCDNKLNGWYRFMGAAGNRMLAKCPSNYWYDQYSCGSYWQGWLLTSHPRQYGEEADGKVCFSSAYRSCYCHYYQDIRVKNCGTFYIYRLDGVPRCDMRYCGAKDKTMIVLCDDSYMQIHMDRKFYNASKYSSITLRDPNCAAYVGYSYIRMGSVPYGCGGERHETAQHIIYKNKVVMKVKEEPGMVTRDHDVEIDVECTYDRDGYAASVSYDPIRKISGNESGVGTFSFELRMYQSQSFSNPYYRYPIKVKLRDYLYFQAKASVRDKGLVLLIDQCYATPDMNRNHRSKYLIFNNGCPVDKTVQFHSAEGFIKRFSMQAFRYLQNETTVYVHCLFLLCKNTSRDFRCHSGCNGNSIGRVKRDIADGGQYGIEEDSLSKYYLLEAGPIVLGEGGSQNKKQGGEKKEQAISITTIGLIAGVAFLAVMVLVLFVKMRRRDENVKHVKEEIGIDNAAQGRRYEAEDEIIDGKSEEHAL